MKEGLKIITPYERLKLTEEHCIPFPTTGLASLSAYDDDRLLRQVPDIMYGGDQESSAGQDVFTSIDILQLTPPFLIEDQSSPTDEECHVVYEDLFKYLCTSSDNLQHSNNDDQGVAMSSTYNHVKPDGTSATEGDRNSATNEPYIFNDSYLDTPTGDEFQLNFNDVNLNSLVKKEKTLEEHDEETCQVLSNLHEVQEWKSSDIDSSISMEAERSMIFSPITTNDFV